MVLSQKEDMLLKDLISAEKLCIERYKKHSAEASDKGLKDIFNSICQSETEHLNTLNSISQGTVPPVGGKVQPPKAGTVSSASEADKCKDSYLCNDALEAEKQVSSEYNTCVFEFTNDAVRDALSHIQQEEQQHGKSIYNYMSCNNMYC